MFIGNSGYENVNFSRIIPHQMEGFNLKCAPTGDGNIHEMVVSKAIIEANPPKSCKLHETEVLLSKTKKHFFIGEENSACRGALIYEKEAWTQNQAVLYYLESQKATLSGNDPNKTVIFHGRSFETIPARDNFENNVNRFHFGTSLQDCTISTTGTNFVHVESAELPCIFDNPYNLTQTNIVSFANGSFADTEGIHAIVGNGKPNTIKVSHAGHVNGQGGQDQIIINNPDAVVTAHPGDFISGQGGLVQLPFSFEEIDAVTIVDDITKVSCKFWQGINMTKPRSMGQYDTVGSVTIGKGVKIMTRDGYMIMPLRTTSRGKVTQLQVVQLSSQPVPFSPKSLETLKNLENPNFKLVKQFFSPGMHATLADDGSNVFVSDDTSQKIIWESNPYTKNMYIIGNHKANYVISNANGILDLKNVGIHKPVNVRRSGKGSTDLILDDIRIRILPNVKVLTLALPGPRYFKMHIPKLIEKKSEKISFDLFSNEDEIGDENVFHLERDLCSHSLAISGKQETTAKELIESHLNCIAFNNDDNVFFTQNDNDLIINGAMDQLFIKDYFKALDYPLKLSVKTKSGVIDPTSFLAKSLYPQTYKTYKINPSSTLTIFHNQPSRKDAIGLLDFGTISKADVSISVDGNDLIFVQGSHPLATLKNWMTNNEVRKILFSFKDSMITRCFSGCEADEIFVDFQEKSSNVRSRREINDSPWSLTSIGQSVRSYFSPEQIIGGQYEETNAKSISVPTPGMNDTLLLGHFFMALFNKTYREESAKAAKLGYSSFLEDLEDVVNKSITSYD